MLSPRRRLASFFLLAFLLHAVLPFFALYQLPQTGGPAQASSVFGDKILICTAEGFQWVAWEDLQSGKVRPEPHPDYKCPLCYLAAHGSKSLVPATDAQAVAYAQAQFAYYSPPDSRTPDKGIAYQHAIRAPPPSFSG